MQRILEINFCFLHSTVMSPEGYEDSCRERLAADNILYDQIIAYLVTGKHVLGLTNTERQRVWRQSVHFEWDDARKCSNILGRVKFQLLYLNIFMNLVDTVHSLYSRSI